MSDDDLATIHPLHPDPVVHEAEVVSEEEYQRLTSHQGQAVERWRGYRADAIVVAKATRTVATHQHTRATAKLVGRHLLYVPAGGWVIWRRWRESHTNVRYDRYIRAAETCANWDNVKEWDTRATAERQRRHTRVMDWIRAPFELVKAVVVLLVSVVVALLGLGVLLAVTTSDPALIVAPVRAVAQAIAWSVWAVTIVWGPLVLAAPWLVLAGLWWLGKQHAPPPAWLAPDKGRAELDRITQDRVILSLEKLGIAELTKAIKDAGDATGMMLSSIVPVGCGYQVDILPPHGVEVAKIMDRRSLFAQNLGRHPHEVFLDVAPKISPEVRAWIANSGALDEPIGPSPLTYDTQLKANYKTGRAPWGRDVRGEPVSLSLYQCHLLLTGASNQGKTRALLSLALWLALDPTVTFWIADLKGIDRETKKSDWEPMREIADRFVAGPADEHVAAATEMVEDAVVEQNRRIMQGGAWSPLVVIVDEAQKAFQCPTKGPDGRPYGGRKDTSRYFMGVRNIHDQGRVVDVLMWQGTQNPTNENLPKLIREGAHIRGSLAVGSEQVAKMAMGDEAFDGGAAPHQLRKGIDRGTVVVTGDGVRLAPTQSSVTVRTHYIDNQAAGEIATRALAKRHGRQRPPAGEPRDLLADVLGVLGDDELVRATSVADRLRERIDHRDYRGLNGTELARRLKELGVEVKQKDGVHVVRWGRVQSAIDRREAGL